MLSSTVWENPMKIIFPCMIALAITFGGAALAADVPGYVARAVANPTRPKADRKFDAHRLPAETIAFAGVKPGMVIGEFIPGYGYFTRLLSDIVGPKGRIYGLENINWTNPAFDKALTSERGRGNVIFVHGRFGEFVLPEKIDLFWITQNYHDLHVTEYGLIDLAAFNREVFDALKPGGIYFISDQEANPGTTEAQIEALHRIEKTQVIREVTAAGFILIGESDVLHRAGDDHTRSIFDAVVRNQTDQFMLKFQKPQMQ